MTAFVVFGKVVGLLCVRISTIDVSLFLIRFFFFCKRHGFYFFLESCAS